MYATLADIEAPVEIVDIFRNAKDALPIAREAIRIGAKVVWMQLGVRNDEAAKLRRGCRAESGDEPLPEDRVRKTFR